MADTPLSPRRLAYLAAVRRQKRRIRSWQIALLAGLFGFWELSCRVGLSDGFLVSCPSRMAATPWSPRSVRVCPFWSSAPSLKMPAEPASM